MATKDKKYSYDTLMAMLNDTLRTTIFNEKVHMKNRMTVAEFLKIISDEIQENAGDYK